MRCNPMVDALRVSIILSTGLDPPDAPALSPPLLLAFCALLHTCSRSWGTTMFQIDSATTTRPASPTPRAASSAVTTPSSSLLLQ